MPCVRVVNSLVDIVPLPPVWVSNRGSANRPPTPPPRGPVASARGASRRLATAGPAAARGGFRPPRLRPGTAFGGCGFVPTASPSQESLRRQGCAFSAAPDRGLVVLGQE